jgi:hypothetical protein
VQVVEDAADRMDEAFEKTTEAIEKQVSAMDELLIKYEHYEELLTKITRFLELSGEFVPSEKLDFLDAIDTWEELD